MKENVAHYYYNSRVIIVRRGIQLAFFSKFFSSDLQIRGLGPWHWALGTERWCGILGYIDQPIHCDPVL